MAYICLLLLSWMAVVTDAQFTPGCSFSSGQCLYNVQLGHEGRCDRAAVTSGGGACCDEIQTQVTEISTDVNMLKSKVATLMSELTSSKNNLSQTTDSLTDAQRQTQQLLDKLAQKETELNTTQKELSQVIGQAGDEIRSLRATVGQLTSELNRCKGTLGMATNTSSLPVSSILPDDVTLHFCDFEHHGGNSDVTCGYNMTSHYNFTRTSGKSRDSTGPLEDHTFGAPSGHYMLMDAFSVGYNTESSGIKTISMTSPEYPPGPGYCIRIWYNMNGHDVKNFSVYAQMESGSGYPIISNSGNLGQKWVLGSADLDREYTSRPFRLVVAATTTAYHGYIHYVNNVHDIQGDVAVDDIYVYNTSCKNIPLCPSGSVTREEGNTTHCYTFHVQPVSWYEAASLCRRQGATTSLVTIASKLEQDFLVATIKNDSVLMSAGQNGFYTAGNDEQSEHTFDWTDTGTPYHGTYSNWKSGQPNNVAGDQDCLLLQYPDLDFQWGDVDCDEQHPYICETQYPTPNAATSSGTPFVG